MTNKFHVEVVGGEYDGFTHEADYLSDIEDFVEEHWDNDSDYWVKTPNGMCMEIRDIYM
jgi:hypothetical protein